MYEYVTSVDQSLYESSGRFSPSIPIAWHNEFWCNESEN